MAFASSVPPARRAELRQLRAAFERAYDAMGDDRDPSTPAFRAADARYRAWIGALDAVALALLDDVDAFEAGRPTSAAGASFDLTPAGCPGLAPAGCPGLAPAGCPGLAPAGLEPGPAEIDGLFAGIEDLRRSVDLIAPAHPPCGGGKPTARARARDVVGHDRVARHWSLSLGGPAVAVTAPRGP